MDISASPHEEASENDLQTDEELNALASIYGDDFAYLDDGGRHFSVRISRDHDASLFINLPPGYPSAESPSYTIVAPAIRGEVRRFVDAKIASLLKNRFSGEAFLFQLIEQARESFQALQVPETPTEVPSEKQSDVDILEKVEEIPEIFHDEPFTERRSTFQAHFAIVKSTKEVRSVLKVLKQNRKIAEATHNIFAYRIFVSEECFLSDCDDDGEAQAASRLLHLLNIMKVSNVLVVVSRWFGGILLGPERFKHITNAARNILSEHSTETMKRTR